MALVLILDDEPDSMLALRIELEAAGHHTVLAADSERATTLLAVGDIDLLLVDVMMPVFDGWTVLAALHLRDRLGPPAVVVVSGRAGRSDLVRAERLGSTVYLAKPFTPDELYQAVDRALG